MKIIRSHELEIVVCSDGAEILSVKRQSEEYIWQGYAKYWGRQAPILFPIVGRLKDDKYTYNGKEFEMTQHGFARDKKFTCIKEVEDELTFELVADEETKKMYPFNFRLTINYKVDGFDLHVSYQVENLDENTMYYSIGGHPGFNIDPANEYTIEFKNNGSMYTLDGPYVDQKVNGIPSEVKFDRDTFINGALIAEPSEESKIVTIKENGIKYVEMDYSEFKLMGVWTPEGKDAPFVCLEPWRGVADFAKRSNNEFQEKDFIDTLEGKESRKMKYKITFN